LENKITPRIKIPLFENILFIKTHNWPRPSCRGNELKFKYDYCQDIITRNLLGTYLTRKGNFHDNFYASVSGGDEASIRAFGVIRAREDLLHSFAA
jgi:hypothetical protein